MTLIGGKDWWLKQVESKNEVSLEPILEVIPQQGGDEDFLYVKRVEPGTPSLFGKTPSDPIGDVYDHAFLQRSFEKISVLDQADESQKVKLGNNKGAIDFLGVGFDGSYWVVEFEILEAERGPGEMKVPIQIPKVSEAIGQSLLYSHLFKVHYPSRASRVSVLPVVCAWTLGSGSREVIETCRKVAVTVITLDTPYFAPHGRALRIYYLREEDPRNFLGNDNG